MKSWVKLYTEVNRDPKIGTLSWAQRGIWYSLLALAGEIDDRNESNGETGKLDTIENVAWRLRCDMDALQGALDEFVTRGMVTIQNDVLFVCNYGRRQGRRPSATAAKVRERVQKHREMKRECNADVTQVKRGVTRTESESESESESDADADADSRGSSGGPTDPLFDALHKAGRTISSLEYDRWMELAAEHDTSMLVLAVQECARQGEKPRPAYVETIAARCEREKCLPGQWPNKASPTNNALDEIDAWQPECEEVRHGVG